jgi:hypothetical protein
MTDETLHSFLARRERELAAQISALRGQAEEIQRQIATKTNEQSDIAGVKAGLRLRGSKSDLDIVGRAFESFVGRQATTDAMPAKVAERFAAMTIKELVIQALLDHFPNGGTAAEIRDFIRDAYARVIPPSSLRPQMSRLKADGVLGQEPSTDVWNLQDDKRVIYAMYDHPSSRAEMKELQDDEVTQEVEKDESAAPTRPLTLLRRRRPPVKLD